MVADRAVNAPGRSGFGLARGAGFVGATCFPSLLAGLCSALARLLRFAAVESTHDLSPWN